MTNPPQDRTRSDRLLTALAYVGFVSLGLPDAVTGVAWPSVRDTFGLEQASLGLVLVGTAGGCFASGFFAGRLAALLGIGLLLAASTSLAAAAGFGYALAPVWAAFLVAAGVHGLASGAIDAGLNAYAAEHLSARHMNWLHACYCLGAMLGPLVMTAVLAAGASWRAGYGLVGSAVLVLGLLFAATRRRWGRSAASDDAGEAPATAGEAFAHPIVRLQMAVFFLYTGLEVAVGQWCFTLLTESRGVSTEAAGVWAGLYWGSIGVGRVLFGFVVDRFGVDRLLRYCLAAAAAGAALYAVPRPETGFAGLALIGLALAPIFPGLMTRTPDRVGRRLSIHAVGFQVSAAMAGVAAIPSAVGWAVERYGLETAAQAAAVLAVSLWLLHELLIRKTNTSPPLSGGREVLSDHR